MWVGLIGHLFSPIISYFFLSVSERRLKYRLKYSLEEPLTPEHQTSQATKLWIQCLILWLPYKFYVLGQIGLSKQCRPRSEAVWSGSTLFAIPSASFGCINAMLHQTFLFLGQLWQLFEVSQILEFLRYDIIQQQHPVNVEKSACP